MYCVLVLLSDVILALDFITFFPVNSVVKVAANLQLYFPYIKFFDFPQFQFCFIFLFSNPKKKLLTKFYTIFGITTSCLLTDMKIRKIEEHFWSRNPLRSPSRIKTHLHDKGKRPNFFGGFPVKI